ncbi:MAG: thiol:disulfide interchange protein DsbG [Gammaproteobacteria bacterium]|nr:thiol:disulfide interchange protein DsbG [Gammaproteobacteria bacterium]
MRIKPYLTPVIVAGILAANVSFAATNSKASAASPAASSKSSDLVMTLTKGQATIVQSFSSLGNLEGFVIKPAGTQQGQPTIIYVDKNGQYAFVGALLTPTGENQSAADSQKYIVSTIAQKAFVQAKDTAWILDGKPNAKHMTYAVADPNCIYCNKLYQVTRPYVQSGDLAIRWIWVGFLKESSAGLAQAILASNDPLKAMATDENGFNATTEQGGLTPIANPPKDVMDKFKKNMDFIGEFQFPGTPVLIYQDAQGKPQAAFGLPVGDQLTKTIDSMGTF